MRIGFFILWLAVLAQRMLELWIAKKNTKWMRKRGGYEVGKDHYHWIILIHFFLFSGILFECLFWDVEPPFFWRYTFVLFLLLQVLRIYVIQSLGPFWNTRIYILPGSQAVKTGIYKYIRHPNYLIVLLETFIFPLLYGAYLTAFFLTLVNGLFFYFVRIPIEEKALREKTSYF